MSLREVRYFTSNWYFLKVLSLLLTTVSQSGLLSYVRPNPVSSLANPGSPLVCSNPFVSRVSVRGFLTSTEWCWSYKWSRCLLLCKIVCISMSWYPEESYFITVLPSPLSVCRHSQANGELMIWELSALMAAWMSDKIMRRFWADEGIFSSCFSARSPSSRSQ